jgi:hypothetical protein
MTYPHPMDDHTGFHDLSKCERCSEDGVGYNEDGEFLCGDCLFEEQCEANPEWEDDHL